MPKWRSEYRRCDNCRSEYRPKREAQSYCSRDCRRAAAYGRERFKAGTVGRRKRRLRASDKLPGTLVAGSFRNGNFCPSETGGYRPTNWIEELNQAVANEIDQAHWNREKRKWPVDVTGGARHSARRPTFTVHPELRQTIIETERLPRNDEPTSHVVRRSGKKLRAVLALSGAHPCLNEADEKLRGLRFAGVATDNVNVIGTFIEGLSWRPRPSGQAVYAAHGGTARTGG